MRQHTHTTLAGILVLALALPAAALARGEGDQDPSLHRATSEARLEGAVWTAYVLNPTLQSFDLSVRVDGEIAELRGEVETPVQRELAEHIARQVPGVAAVDNRIVATGQGRAAGPSLAGREFATRVADLNLAAEVHQHLRQHELFSALNLEVNSRDGEITLLGRTDHPEHRELAEQLVKEIQGVQSVDNRLHAQGL